MNDQIDLCKPMSECKYIYAFDVKKHTKITTFEKFCLFFIKAKYYCDQIERTTIVYKIFMGKMYIIDHIVNTK